MTPAELLRSARHEAGLTQRELAERSATSQATLSAYESGRKDPAASVLLRVLAAAGRRPVLQAAEAPVRTAGRAERERRGRELVAVIGLAEALPARHARALAYPPIAGLTPHPGDADPS